ncbi:MAG: sulfotransferase [Rhizobiaceae bacterium]|nr:sulfotransferase [Rhizobiaceae bacterium]MCV0408648.1 sulfotransferase [Rhizobiaceae bacterium]
MLDHAEALFQSGDLRRAEAICRTTLETRPSDARAHSLAGRIYLAGLDHDRARAHLEKAVRRSPDDATAALALAGLLREQNLTARTLPLSARAARLAPRSAEAARLHAELLADMGRGQEAIETLKAAMARMPDPDRMLLNAFARIHRFGPDDPEFARLTRDEPEAMDPPAQYNLLQARAKALDEMGRHEEAIETMIAARRLIRPYDLDLVRAERERIAGTVTERFLAGRRGWGNASERPIFIVGMPRSGTSLVEQIIASHGRAAGAGEMPDIELLRAEADETEITQAQASVLAGRYMKRLEEVGGSTALRVTDKTPQNFWRLGLIATLFPKARIIHCRRDPLDTCISCFMSALPVSHGYVRDLTTLGAYWNDYDALMRHWSVTLGDRVLHVDYETLVNDLEAGTRRILDHAGLDWDDRCLEFWKTERAVSTLSREQVREPAYRSSIGRWRRYGAAVEPLRNIIASRTPNNKC